MTSFLEMYPPCTCNSQDCLECNAYEPRQHTPKCGLCGRFTSRLHLVYSGGPYPEPDYEVGNCCLKPFMRTRP